MRKRPLCVVCIGLMIAIWLCRTAGIPIFGEPRLPEDVKSRLRDGQEITLTGLVTDRRVSSENIRYTLRHVHVTFGDRQIPFKGVFVSTEYRDERSAAEPGDLIRARGTLRAVESAGNPGQFDAAAYYACQKIYYRLWADTAPEIHRKQSMRKVLYRLRESLTGTYTACMHEGPAGILSAMLLGDKAFLTEESRRNFQVGGCLHLLVISGLHVTLLGMGLLQFLLRLRIPQTPACIAASGCMILYTALTGFPVAAVRACIMFLILLFARVMRLSYDSACAMAMAAILLLAAGPGWLFHAGFQLSFAAAGAASLVSPLLGRSLAVLFEREELADTSVDPGGKRHERNAGSRKENEQLKRISGSVLRGIKENTILWGAVQLCTLPLTAWYFFEIPTWSLLLNLLLVPCVQYVLGAGVIGSLACLAFPQAGRWLLFPADLGLGLFDRILGLTRLLPGSSVVCGRPALWQVMIYYAVLLLVLFTLHRRCGRKNVMRLQQQRFRQQRSRQKRSEVRKTWLRCGCMMAAACMVLFCRYRAPFSLTMLDVGQGDCLVIQSGRTVFLSDGGSTDVPEVGKYRVLPALESEGIAYVDGVFISHNDADHMNGIEEMLVLIAEKKTAVRIGCVWMPAWMAETDDGRRIAGEARAAGAGVGFLKRGDALTAGDLRIDVLHPFRQQESPAESREINDIPTGGAQSGNAGSVVFQVSYQGFTALLTGDLEKEGEEELLPYLEDIDCLKVGHHGSRWSSSAEFLEITRPEIALVSAPAKSMYGHPHQETLDRLTAAGAEIFATKDCGAVEIRVKGSGGMEVSPFTRRCIPLNI